MLEDEQSVGRPGTEFWMSRPDENPACIADCRHGIPSRCVTRAPSAAAHHRQGLCVSHAAVFLEANKPQPVVLYELVKGWLTGTEPELGKMHTLKP